MKRPREVYAAQDLVSKARENAETVRFVRQKKRLFFVLVLESQKVAKRTQHQKPVVPPVAHDAVAAAPAEVLRGRFVVHVEVENLDEMAGKVVLWFGSWWSPRRSSPRW